MKNEQTLFTPNSPMGAKSLRDSERNSFTGGATSDSHAAHKNEIK